MANAHSPTRFNGEADSFFDPNFTLDINRKMRVPKSIRVNGEFDDSDMLLTNGGWSAASEKLDMNVPDRILVVGQEQHMGTKAPPREIVIDNSVLPSDPPVVRCITPPRVLTLDNHYFPTVDEDNRLNHSVDVESTPRPNRELFNNDLQVSTRNVREQTPAFGGALDTTLPAGEELHNLRRQVGKLNRRVMAIESEMQQQQQKTKFMYVMTAIYICFKTFSWFLKN